MDSAGNALWSGAVGVTLAAAVGFLFYKLISPRGSATSATKLGRRWCAWMTFFATVTLLPKFFRKMDGEALFVWLLCLLTLGGTAFLIGWLHGFVKFGRRTKAIISPPMPPSPNHAPSTQTSENSSPVVASQSAIDDDIASRLSHLKVLFEKALISKEEYGSAKRQDILKDI